MGCNVSLPDHQLKRQALYKDPNLGISVEALKEERVIMYQNAADSSFPRQDLPDFVVKKRVKKKKDSIPVTFAQEYLDKERPPQKRKFDGKLTFTGGLNSLPSKFTRVGSSFQKQIHIQINEIRDKAEIRNAEQKRTVKTASTSPDRRKFTNAIRLNEELSGCVRNNYKLRWTIKPQNHGQEKSLVSINTHQGSCNDKISLSSKISRNSRGSESDLSLCHHLPYRSIEPKLITEVLRKCNSEPRNPKGLIVMEKSSKLRKATMLVQNHQSIESLGFAKNSHPEARLKDEMKKRLKITSSIQELELDQRSHQKAIEFPQNLNSKSDYLEDTVSSRRYVNRREEASHQEERSSVQAVDSPLIKMLVEDAAKRSNPQRRKPSLFKADAEKAKYKQFLSHLQQGDKKKSSNIMAPNKTIELISPIKDHGVVRSSLKRSTFYGKSTEPQEVVAPDSKSSLRRKSLPAIVETEEEYKQSQQIDESVRKGSIESSLMIEKLVSPALRRKSQFSIDKLAPLVRTGSRDALLLAPLRHLNASLKLDSRFL